MPYITPDARSKYDSVISVFVETLNRKSFFGQVPAVLIAILEGCFGNGHDTRYVKQNEAVGVLACMEHEWRRRMELGAVLPDCVEIARDSLDVNSRQFVEKMIRLLSQEDSSVLAGHLNYSITVLMLESVRRTIVGIAEIPALISGVRERWYDCNTAPYEDSAIKKN
ncbi:MAG: hypothetical protein KDD53_00605, partial [Bdellovibrionales bacterium]|nr:hypothetical protein [Bdellovibrionales bacterium]